MADTSVKICDIKFKNPVMTVGMDLVLLVVVVNIQIL